MDEVEQGDGDGAVLNDLDENPEVLSLGRLSARSVRSESDPVGYQPLTSAKLCHVAPGTIAVAIHTGLLLLESHLVPVNLHAVPELHPQIGLLLKGKTLPAFLDTGECGIGNGVLGGGADLLGSDGLLLSLGTGVHAGHGACGGAVGANGRH